MYCVCLASMEAFVNLLLLLCAFNACETPIHANKLQGIGFSFKLHHMKYFACRIPYHPNSSATFQVDLLVFGDISPNPVPDDIINSSVSPLISYNRDELRHLHHVVSTSDNSLFRIPPSVLSHIESLGIQRKQYRTRAPCPPREESGSEKKKIAFV